MSGIEIHGYAIVTDDDRIADEGGRMPDVLRNEADWAYFQAGLDEADLSALGRLGHEANPNRRNRPRLVLSSAATGLEKRPDAWWWNPSALSWDSVAETVLPQGGRVAVPGGKRVFDLFLAIGYDAFHLSRAHGSRLRGGIALFEACDRGMSAEEVLASHGLDQGPPQVLDPDGPVTLAVWRPATLGQPRR
ncbi:hypothetical protein [Microvirga pudoricolor]|uniref:hypothetical protein n=1 Tax=Microvirga pudoricolor TaxID=2778729 RepID=UPI00194FFB6A|nr:hypothetical protein [Microvirga pudoricolor]MBM6596442.1 hypothetical protein [Microvirga pudoricolor]